MFIHLVFDALVERNFTHFPVTSSEVVRISLGVLHELNHGYFHWISEDLFA